MGLYAGRDIGEGHSITVYLGRRVDLSVESIYSISNGSCILDCDAWSEGDPYLGAHMANDSNWGTKDGVELKECNGTIGPRYEFIAQRDSSEGGEFRLS